VVFAFEVVKPLVDGMIAVCKFNQRQPLATGKGNEVKAI
jgi:hypothetical protein